jgi:integrase
MSTFRRRHFGSVRRLPSGRWQATYWHLGQRHPGLVTFKTKGDALAWLSSVETDIRRGAWTDPSKGTTVGEWLDYWLTSVVEGRVGSDNTLANYATIVRVHLKPSLGDVGLARLTPEQVDDFLASKARAGRSKSYVARMRNVLADALSHAERRRLVTWNAAKHSVMPKCKPAPERRSFTAGEARAILKAAKPERLHALVVAGMTVGLRPGELTGLLWADIDMDGDPATLAVTGSMKRRPDSSLYRGPVKRSTAGQRVLAIPPALCTALREHRKRQAAERLIAGKRWQDHGLVFCSEVGTPLDPSNVRKVFTRVASNAGIEPTGVVPYLLRHSAVSLLLDAGAPIEEVADLLGDDPQTLYRHYRHRIRPVVTVAADRIEAALAAKARPNASRTNRARRSISDLPPTPSKR